MSWGYFLDATLPDAAWKTISKQKTDEFPTKVSVPKPVKKKAKK